MDFKCVSNGCEILPIFGYPDKRNMCCLGHKNDDMVFTFEKDDFEACDLFTKKLANWCISKDCTKRATYNFKPETKPIFCKTHRLETMVDQVSRKCVEEGCLKQPAYNLPTETVALYCGNHRAEGMENIRSKRCAEVGCSKIPTFNLATETTALYCAGHQKAGMIDIRSSRCAHHECTKRPIFNMPTETRGLYCADHKLPEMIDVKNRKCAYPGCSKLPNYNSPSEKKALFCRTHREDGMENVKSRTFAEEGCSRQPIFNVPTETKGLFCFLHKRKEMNDVKNKTCAEEGCLKQPKFNLPSAMTGLFCVAHKAPGMIDVTSSRCKGDNCDVRANIPKYRGYCANCFIHLFPDEEVSKQYKIKERHYTDIIKEAFPNIAATYDRTIQGGCSRRRPDFFVDLGAFTLHVEIDEFDHRYRDTTCEVAKINETFTDLADRPMVLLRTNPDAYVDEEGRKQKSCFRAHAKTGILIVADKTELKKRTDKMVDRIRHWLHRAENDDPPTEPMTIEYQFTSRHVK